MKPQLCLLNLIGPMDPCARNFRQALSGDFMSQLGMLEDYAMVDARLLTRKFKIPFLDKSEAPAFEGWCHGREGLML